MNEEEAPKPDCYACRFRGALVGDRHSCCRHPDGVGDGDAFEAFMKTAGGLMGTTGDSEKLGIRGDAIGIRRGWFFWPTNFDPVWLRTCNGFEPRETS